MSEQAFPVLLLLGRPAAGKSAVIELLRSCPAEERLRRFHVAAVEVLEERRYLLDSLESDEIMSRHGKPRLFTDGSGLLLDDFLWDYFIEKMNCELHRRLAADPELLSRGTVLVELCRGGHGAYGHALTVLDPALTGRAPVLYLDIPFEGSSRRWRQRLRQEQVSGGTPAPPAELSCLFRFDGWEQLSANDPSHLACPAADRIPYTVLRVEPEEEGELLPLDVRLEEACRRLWELREEADGDPR